MDLSRNYEFYLVITNYWPYGLPYIPDYICFPTRKYDIPGISSISFISMNNQKI